MVRDCWVRVKERLEAEIVDWWQKAVEIVDFLQKIAELVDCLQKAEERFDWWVKVKLYL